MKIQNKAPMLLAVCLSALLVAGCSSELERHATVSRSFPDAQVVLIPDSKAGFVVLQEGRVLHVRVRSKFFQDTDGSLVTHQTVLLECN
jgi:hypothetical protein